MTDNKSINASSSTETPLLCDFGTVWRMINGKMQRVPLGHPHLYPNNGYDSGVNPTHSLETQV